ncbi:hypothetical protein C5Y96_00425 [Blastopirellula marina]|uniref:DUF2997 domain-containing protein n=1 Tax=Blastopirellula marina TaxID=124 RepID=A0A2S8GBV5_9BACT|nr:MULTISPECIES: DUF2997 domain-containing protein [Pirellulaceae]PQO41790.1 hypothetical protein C5Y96_00425 [Blastopirellula marina]RCS56342.1 DUF2997 domain-containing protein [Bremerella cremea]
MKTIEIIVSPTGQLRLETRGFQGTECREASRFLEAALGQQTSETLTAEFHVTEITQQNQIEQKE